MINLNNQEKVAKSSSLVMKLMFLLVLMSVVGCERCNKDNKASQLKLKVEITPTKLEKGKAKVTVINCGNEEFDFNNSTYKLVVSEITAKEKGTNKVLSGDKYKVGYTIGGESGKSDKQFAVDLKQLFKDKKLAANGSDSVDLEITDVDDNGQDNVAEVELSISIKDKELKEDVVDTPAKCIYIV